MIMEFYFDDEKCEKAGYEKEECLNALRRHFAKNNQYGTIKETSEGIFEGEWHDFDAFGTTIFVTNCEWFKSTTCGWYWTVPEWESGKEREDMIASAKEYGQW